MPFKYVGDRAEGPFAVQIAANMNVYVSSCVEEHFYITSLRFVCRGAFLHGTGNKVTNMFAD